VDFVRLAAFDQHQNTRAQFDSLAGNNRETRTANDVQPLIRPTMTILRVPLRPSGWKSHLGRLGVLVAQEHAETRTEAELFVLHSSGWLRKRVE